MLCVTFASERQNEAFANILWRVMNVLVATRSRDLTPKQKLVLGFQPRRAVA
jgi:hypothetical protein